MGWGLLERGGKKASGGGVELLRVTSVAGFWRREHRMFVQTHQRSKEASDIWLQLAAATIQQPADGGLAYR